LPHHSIERFGNTMADSRVVIRNTHVPGHVRICARAWFRSMSNDPNGWDLPVSGLGDKADLIARLRELSGQGSELAEAPAMNKRHMHRV
jgi:hypothetical protein